MKGFRFYSPFEGFGIDFWELCATMRKYKWKDNWNESCFEILKEYSAFGSRVAQFSASVKVWNNHDEINYTNLFARNVLAFPANESSRVTNEVMSGAKVAMVGLNSEIDEIIAPMALHNPSVTFFRGKDNLWSYMKNWVFVKSSYSQTRQVLIRFMNHGIYSFWKYWLRDRKYIVSKLKMENRPPIPLSLGSNVFFVFVIIALGFIAAVLVLLFEYLIHKFPEYKQLKATVQRGINRGHELFIYLISARPTCACKKVENCCIVGLRFRNK